MSMRKQSAVPLVLAVGFALLVASSPSIGAVKGRAAPKAKRPAAAKPSPTQVLSGMLYLNRFEPAENLAQSCNRANYKMLALSLATNADWIGRNKGEFETSAQFAERSSKLEAAVNSNGGIVVCHDLTENPDALFVYHADEGEYQGGFNLYQNVWRDAKTLGTYATKTRMGVPVTVRAKLELEYDAAFKLFSPTGDCLKGVTYYTFKFPYPIEKAPALKRLTEKEGGQYQRHVIQPRLRDNDGTTHVDRYCPAAVCQSRPAFAQ